MGVGLGSSGVFWNQAPCLRWEESGGPGGVWGGQEGARQTSILPALRLEKGWSEGPDFPPWGCPPSCARVWPPPAATTCPQGGMLGMQLGPGAGGSWFSWQGPPAPSSPPAMTLLSVLSLPSIPGRHVQEVWGLLHC